MSAVRFIKKYALLLLLVLGYSTIQCSTNITNNDPYPVYTALYPYTFLTNNLRDYYIGVAPTYKQEHFCFSISPFRQEAVVGRDINKDKVPLGDLKGRWNMLALFYPGTSVDPVTTGTNFVLIPSTAGPNLTAQHLLINTLGLTDTEITTSCGNLFNPDRIDTKHEFGFFSVPIKYRKYGVRFELEVQLFCDIGLQVQAGVCDILQTATFNDLTCQALGSICPIATGNGLPGTLTCNPPAISCCNIDNFGCDCKRIVIENIMRQKELIAKTLKLNIKNFDVRGAEDTHVNLYWRHVFPVNQHREGWPYFLMMPFFVFETILPTGVRVNPNCLFALPTGNNGHAGVGFTTGVNIDFIETIEIGVQAGMTAFKSLRYPDMPVPVQEFQVGMLPYKADLVRKPGTNWNFAALMNARHFLYQLSVWAQYMVISHGKDKFCDVKVLPLTPADTNPPIALTKKMSDESEWHSHVFNVGATYDISPNIALGFFWQAPVSRRNAYRSTTVMGSLIVTW